MSEMALSDAREHLGDLVNRASYAGERVYLTRRGKRVAALVPAQVLEDLEAAEDAVDLAEAAKAREEDGESIPLEQVKAELGL
jgi:prevent-host-death family protein